jgi:hypothetical protein
VNLLDIVEHMGGSVGLEPGMLKEVAWKNGKDILNLSEEETQNVKEQSLAVVFTFGSDRHRFSKLLDKLQNDFLQGNDGYQKHCNQLTIYYPIGNTIILNQTLATMMVFHLPQQTAEVRRIQTRV